MSAKHDGLIRILSNPFLIAIFLAIPSIIFLQSYFPRYKFALESSGTAEKDDGIQYYYDLDNDGYSEKILSFTNTRDSASIKVTDRKGSIIFSSEFNGDLLYRGARLVFGDINGKDGPEIIAFYIRKDSLFFEAIEYGPEKTIIVPDRFIAQLRNPRGKTDYMIIDGGIHDLNNDGNQEFIFAVMGGFTIYPRNVYTYNLQKDELLVSQHLGSSCAFTKITDFDLDGKKEIFLGSYAPANMEQRGDNGLHDSSAWLIVLDDQLNFKFPPYEFEGYTSSVQVDPFIRDGNPFIGVVYGNRLSSARQNELCIFDSKGNLLASRYIDVNNGLKDRNLIISENPVDRLRLLDPTGEIIEYDQSLNVLKKFKLKPFNQILSYRNVDLDLDGMKEFLFLGNGKDVLVTRHDLHYPVNLNLAIDRIDFLSLKLNGQAPPEIFFQTGRRNYLCIYKANPLYYWQYPIYLLVYLAIVLLIFLAQYTQKFILKDKYQAEKKISELQLLMLKDQMDPHFMFNAINSINSMIALNKPDEAQQRILRLTRLLRTIVESSGKISRTIGQETDFVRNYLEFQKNRYTGTFDYSLEISPEVNPEWEVPRMAIQIYVENAVKHGILPLQRNGMIRINIYSNHNNIRIDIEDNGIGRKAAAQLNQDSTGRGLEILDQYFEILNRYNTEKITYSILDLESESGQAKGTKVEITIPVNMKYKIYES